MSNVQEWKIADFSAMFLETMKLNS